MQGLLYAVRVESSYNYVYLLNRFASFLPMRQLDYLVNSQTLHRQLITHGPENFIWLTLCKNINFRMRCHTFNRLMTKLKDISYIFQLSKHLQIPSIIFVTYASCSRKLIYVKRFPPLVFSTPRFYIKRRHKRTFLKIVLYSLKANTSAFEQIFLIYISTFYVISEAFDNISNHKL